MAEKMATLTELKNYFGFEKASDFSREWKVLTPESQLQLKTGIGNGSLTY